MGRSKPAGTEEDARQVLADGNSLEVALPNYPGCDLFADEVKDWLYEIWLNEEGQTEPVARLPWGEFTVVGFGINIGRDEELADLFVEAGAKDERNRQSTPN